MAELVRQRHPARRPGQQDEAPRHERQMRHREPAPEPRQHHAAVPDHSSTSPSQNRHADQSEDSRHRPLPLKTLHVIPFTVARLTNGIRINWCGVNLTTIQGFSRLADSRN